MFQLERGSNRECDGVTRRDVLRVGSLAALGLSLPGFLRARALAVLRIAPDCFRPRKWLIAARLVRKLHVRLASRVARQPSIRWLTRVEYGIDT